MAYIDNTFSNDLLYDVAFKGYKRLRIIPNVNGATVTFVATGGVIQGNSIWVLSGTNVDYEVGATGFFTVKDSVTVTSNTDINVSLIVPNFIIGGSDSNTKGILIASEDGVTWTTPVDILSSIINYQNGIYANGKYVLVGSNESHQNYSIYSNLGDTWNVSLISDASGTVVSDIVFGTGKYIVVGSISNRPALISSIDAITWSQPVVISEITFGSLRSIAYGLINGTGTFVAVGAGSKVILTPDGLNYSIVTISPYTQWYGAAYGDGKFVIVSSTGYTGVSTDGENWTINQIIVNDNPIILFDVAYGDGKFVVVGQYGYVGVSTDGENWTMTLLNSGALSKVEYGNGAFVASATSTGDIAVSFDGENWDVTTILSEGTTYWRSVLIKESTMITLTVTSNVEGAVVSLQAGGYTQVDNTITVPYGTHISYTVSATGYATKSGSTIIYQDTTLNVSLDHLKTINVVAIPDSATVTLMSDGCVQSGNSIDAPVGGTVNWTVEAIGYNIRTGSLTVSDDQILTIILDGSESNLLVTSYESGVGSYVASSSDGGNSWSEPQQLSWVTDGSTFSCLDSIRVNNKTLFVGKRGSSGSILFYNGTGFDIVHEGGVQFNRIKYLGNRFVAVGNDGYVAYSSNGTTWSTATVAEPGTGIDLVDVDMAHSAVTAVDGTSKIYRSTNLSSWGVQNLIQLGINFNCISAFGGTYGLLALGYSPSDSAMKSAEWTGGNWGSVRNIGNSAIYPSSIINSLTSSGSALYAVGKNGCIWVDEPSWTNTQQSESYDWNCIV